jgi:hypothetical protein
MTIRMFVATEGATDEAVAERIIKQRFASAEVAFKRFPSRGIDTVVKLAPMTVRAAHYGLFDAVVIHFDLDDTLSKSGAATYQDSPRWVMVSNLIAETLNVLPEIPGRTCRLRIALMAPLQSTESWLAWGNSGSGQTTWEHTPRRTLKTILFGTPPLPTVEKLAVLTDSLESRMKITEEWPGSLRFFCDQLDACCHM